MKKLKAYYSTRLLITSLCIIFALIIAPTMASYAKEQTFGEKHRKASYDDFSIIIDKPKNDLVEQYRNLNDMELVIALQNIPKIEAEEIINKLGDRAKNLPAVELSEIFGLGNAIEFAIKFHLSSLMYAESIEGIKQFQEDIGEEQTGVITFFQMDELKRRFNRTRESSVIPSGIFFGRPQVLKFADHVSVKGTWTMDNEIMGNPINVAKISCFKNHLECREIVADVTIPLIYGEGDSYYLGLNERKYTVLSWSKDEIVSSRDDMCETSIMTINFKNDEVVEMVRNKKNDGCFSDEYVKSDNFQIPQLYRLSPGYETTNNWWRQRKKETEKFYNKRYFDGILENLSETGTSFNP